MISAQTDSHEVIEFTFDKPRKLLADYPAQIELETKTGLGMQELWTALVLKISPRLIMTSLWVLMKHAGEKVPPLKEFDVLMERARGREYEYTEKGQTKTGHVTNAYLAKQIVDALRRGHAFDEVEDEAKSGADDDAGETERQGPTSAASPTT